MWALAARGGARFLPRLGGVARAAWRSPAGTTLAKGAAWSGAALAGGFAAEHALKNVGQGFASFGPNAGKAVGGALRETGEGATRGLLGLAALAALGVGAYLVIRKR